MSATYRPEIDGLRALAVLPVILFHAGVPALSGGYVGVDVFFVISGFLITQIILQERANGSFTIGGFYERRARRILPALFFVMLVCMPFAWFWMLPQQLDSFATSVAAVALFASNVLFWRTSGYFDPAVDEQVLLHTWSLAVEEQFYLIFPLLVAIGWRLGLRRLGWLVAALALISLALCEWTFVTGRTMTGFYLAPTRAWELLCGSLVAFWRMRQDAPETPPAYYSACGVIGLLMILGAVLVYDEATPFPSTYALMPTLGSALILAFAVSGTWPARLLASKWLVGIGLISYSAYLWHQPLFAFAKIHSLRPPPLEVFVALSVVSLVLAYFSWRYVERPFRDRRKWSRRQIFTASAIGTTAMIAVGLIGSGADGFPQRWQLPATVASTLTIGDTRSDCFDVVGVHERSEGWYCNVGGSARPPEFVVFGDSHALAMLPVLNRIADQTDSTGIFVGASGCLPFLEVHALRPDQAIRDCHALNRRVYDYVRERRIELVYLVARWTYYTDGGYDGADFSYVGLQPNAPRNRNHSREAFEVGLRSTVAEFSKVGTRVVLVNQIPQQRVDPSRAYYFAFAQPDPEALLHRASVSMAEHRALQSFVRNRFDELPKGAVTLLTLDNYLCTSTECSIGTANESFYSDEDHLSVAGGQQVQPGLLAVHASQLRGNPASFVVE